MGILHPGITQSSLVLRSETGQRLSILQFDGNFVYLEDLVLGVSQSLASLPLVPAGGTGGQVLAKVSGTDYALEWIDQTGGTSGGGTGTAGTSGTSGTSGVNGTSGTSGVDGTSGTSGIDGTSGTSGIDGTSGTSGIDGTSGTSGIDGTSGTSGIDGTSGTSGIDGTSGTSGEKGAVGSTFNILGIFQNYTELTLAVGTMSSITPPNNFDSYIVIDTSNVWVYGPTESVANSDGWVDMGAIEGPQGLPGENGTSGTSGVNGVDGANGTSGVNGADGANGTSGTSGVNGADGTSGTSGVNGADGIGIPTGGATGQVLVKSSEVNYEVGWADQTGGAGTGTNGTSGTSGVNGADGVNGTNGTSGVNGADGANGTSGTSGVNGGLDIINNIFSLSSYDFNSLDPNILLPGDYFVDINNDSYEIQLPWDINFLGTTYSSVWLNTNSYLTFGASSSASQSIAPGLVVPPAIFVGAGDNSLQGYYFGFDDVAEEIFRIRYEGSHDESGDFLFNPTIVWEMIFNFNSPNDIKLVLGYGEQTAAPFGVWSNLRNPGGVYGVSDGTNWVERFTAVPTYDEKTNTVLNTVDILSITSGASYSQSTNEIKFVGPGVYKVSEGTKTTINIDPLNQYGLSLNYDIGDFSGLPSSIISANKYDLRLTTGKDGSAVRLRPRGDVYLQPYNRNDNQYGPGYNVRLIGSNASQDAFGDGDYNGGSIFITPGLGIGTGVKGNVIIGTASSFVNIFGTMSINSVSGWSGTYSTGDGRVATVSSGIITGVA